jgi:alpha-L-fucosidase
MNRRTFLAGAAVAAGSPARGQRYEPNWKSIDQRPIPKWFNEAKFGIFVVWGPYSVPAWVDNGYAEWYGKRAEDRNSEVGKFHIRNYGADFRYEDFAPLWKAELWDPDAWADLFVRAGARYVVTTAKYHDGFCLWPCATAQTIRTKRWNSAVTGPKRDLLGELNEAGRKRGLKMGIYYSFYEWWHPLWLSDRERFVSEQLHPNFKEVVTKYQPPVIFLDGEWEMNDKQWRSEELAAWLYNESPVRDFVAVNDRWGQTRSLHGDYYSSEYGGGEYPPTHPWQEDRGIGKSYGYNRKETIADYDTAENLIRMLSKVCGNGGNLLLDVGPTADGRIPVIMQERLLQIGAWLEVNGEAIYGSQASPFWPRRFEWGTATQKPGRIYLHVHEPGRREIVLRGLRNRVRGAYLLSREGKRRLAAGPAPGGVRIPLEKAGAEAAVAIVVLEIDGEPDVDKTAQQFEDGSVFLHCYAFQIHGKRARVRFNGYERTVHITDWSDPGEWVSAEFDLLRAGTFEVGVTHASGEGSEYTVTVDGQELCGRTGAAGGRNRYRTDVAGRVRLAQPGRYRVAVKPGGNWKGLALQAITLRPESSPGPRRPGGAVGR